MNVLYVLHTARPGGAAQSLQVLLDQWRKNGDVIRPILAMPRDGAMFDEFARQGWPVFEIPATVETRPSNAIKTLHLMKKVLLQQRALVQIIKGEEVDVVHSNSTAAHLAGGLAARRCRIRSIWQVRDLAPLGSWGRLLAAQADVVIAISRAVIADLVAQKVPIQKIHHIYNTLDEASWPLSTAPDPSIRQALQASESDVVFACMGQLVPWKQQRLFIETAAEICRENPDQHAKFAIIGSDFQNGNSAYRRSLMQQAKALGLGRNLVFIPHQQNNRATMAAIDVLVHCAVREPFGRVIIEAMALQKPVVAFDAAGPGEIITSGQDGLLVPIKTGSAGLKDAMTKVLLLPELRQRLGEASRETVLHRFDAKAGAAKVRRLY